MLGITGTDLLWAACTTTGQGIRSLFVLQSQILGIASKLFTGQHSLEAVSSIGYCSPPSVENNYRKAGGCAPRSCGWCFTWQVLCSSCVSKNHFQHCFSSATAGLQGVCEESFEVLPLPSMSGSAKMCGLPTLLSHPNSNST